MAERQEWFTAQELAGMPGMPTTYSAVIRWGKKNLADARSKPRGKGLEYARTSLPDETRAYLDGREVEQLLQAIPTPVATAVATVTRHLPAPVPGRPVTPITDAQIEPHLTTAQRELLTAKRLVLQQIHDLAKTAGLSTCAACHLLLEKARAGELRPELLGLIKRARSTKGRKQTDPSGLPSVRVLQRWASDQRDGRALAPRPSALPDLQVKPWHPLAIELKARPQGGTLTWVHEQMAAVWQPELGPLPSYDALARFFRDKYSKTDQLKGRYTGSELRSRTFYQHRTSNGMAVADEVHADGWTTHFTAPHPVNGDFVTYEVWHFHDVATRYVTPMAIGLTENTDVILEGLRECIRVLGVMAIWQTDSTGSVKNARVEFDPAASIAERLGISIVHPVTVGNSQANGIAENFNTWLDREARELATYQHPDRMDSGTFKKVQKITRAMVRAADDPAERERKRQAAIRMGKGIVFDSHAAAVAWIRSKEDKWNDHPHRSLPKVRNAAGRLVHMSPRQALQAEIANGWAPVELTAAELRDGFLPHLRKKITRGTVTPYNGQRYRDTELDHHEGEEVLVAVDVDDPARVWVKDLQGRLICEALLVEATGYRSESMAEHSKRKRAEKQIRRRELQINTILDRMAPPPALEMDDGSRVLDLPQHHHAEPLHTTAELLPLVPAADPADEGPDPIEVYLMRRVADKHDEAAARARAEADELAAAMKKAAEEAARADDDDEGFERAAG